MQTEELCPGTTDFRLIKQKQGVFEKAVLRAKELVKRGADTIAFASCIKKGTPIGFPCPFAKKMMEAVSNAVGEDVEILDYTH